MSKQVKIPKHKVIYDTIYSRISSGEYKPGSRIPTEAEFVKFFKTSRFTVSRALRDLENNGLIYRIQGSGSYVSERVCLENITLGFLGSRDVITPPDPNMTSIFGQLIPLMSGEASRKKMRLVLSDLPSSHQRMLHVEAMKMCDNFIDTGIRGVFFLPFEFTDDSFMLNKMITDKLSDAGIKIVLLDRDIYDSMSDRSEYDIVATDNTKSSYILTQHLITHGCKNVCILAEETHNSVINERISGYKLAISDSFLPGRSVRLLEITTDNADEIRSRLLSLNADGIVCINDRIAAVTMRVYTEAGIRIPEEVKIVGFDDLPLSSHLTPPLTTMRQPVKSLACEAVHAMISRFESPSDPPREIRIHAELVTRKSCGC